MIWFTVLSRSQSVPCPLYRLHSVGVESQWTQMLRDHLLPERIAQYCHWKKRNNYNYTSYWCLCIIGRNPYTVDREIFAVKIFSSLVIATKIRHVKIWHAMLYQLHGWGSNKNYLTWKFYRRKFPDLRISCTLALQLHTYVEQIEGRTLTNWVNFTHYIIQNAHLVYRGYMYQAARNACACLLT